QHFETMKQCGSRFAHCGVEKAGCKDWELCNYGANYVLMIARPLALPDFAGVRRDCTKSVNHGCLDWPLPLLLETGGRKPNLSTINPPRSRSGWLSISIQG